MAADDRPYKNTVAVLATMHGKERVIAPVLKEGLGLVVGLAMGVDTDTFGTFSRDVERTGSQLDAARAKIAAGFKYAPYARVGLASEGSFGPHPYIPFLPLSRELVLLIDRERDLELTGYFASPETNYGHAVVTDMVAAAAFAERSKFPEHGLIVMGCVDGKPAPGLAVQGRRRSRLSGKGCRPGRRQMRRGLHRGGYARPSQSYPDAGDRARGQRPGSPVSQSMPGVRRSRI